MNEQIRELMEKYQETFGEGFPLMMCMDMTDSEIEKRLRDCLESGEPFMGVSGAVY